ncbi:MAG: glutamyl-tRNA reductase [Candidatus Dormibacteria bacterium]
MRLVAAGLSHRTAPVAVRERAVVTHAGAPALLRYLVGHAGLNGAAVLSTCNRTEFYITCPDGLVADVIPRLARYLDPAGGGDVATHLQAQVDADALRHLFRVAAGLDSMVVGEAQILGQVKAAHRLAREAGTLDPRLDFAFRRAASAGKRVRTETAVGRGAGSLTEVAIDQARSILGGLRGRGVLLVGAGKMSRSAARRLVDEGARLSVASRGGETALALAERLGAGTVAIDRKDIAEAAADVDVILCSTSSAEPVLTAADLRGVQRRRGGRPLPVLDIAVPRDVEA